MKTMRWGTSNGQASYYVCRGYFKSRTEIQECIDYVKCRHFAYILHDKDVFTESDEQHNIGDKKQEHWHLCINLTTKQTFKWLKDKFNEIAPDCNLWCHQMDDSEKAYEYLTHSTEKAINQGKTRYLDDDVFSDNKIYWTSEECKEDVKEDHNDYILTFLEDICQYGYCPRMMIREYVTKYGRDFIFNYNKALTCASDILGCTKDELFIEPDKRHSLIDDVNQLKELKYTLTSEIEFLRHTKALEIQNPHIKVIGD